ncbi:replication initiation regulator SeqA [Celerinatantimonas yamalensis]|uniref:Negative modulator of initiation of replication n=1 Tax=Celerinatantimonas yamalensis TaxID=559956 RepID=A0ABW9G308_9GAMM
MKSIEIDEELYHYIASQTQHIGESASHILRRLLNVDQSTLLTQVVTVSTEPCRSLHDLVDHALLTQQDSCVKRFMLLLSYLYQANPESFARASEIKGNKRVYFATSEQILLASGKTTKPKPIAESPFWVITNTNTSRKRLIISQLMRGMGYTDSDIEALVNTI